MANTACTPSTFALLSIQGATINAITAELVRNYTASSPPFFNPNHGVIPPVQLDFCNVTVSHKHDGHEEAILTQVWLPVSTWNHRLQAIGGGGFIAGLFSYMFIAMDAAIAEGYAAVSTNAGIYATDINGGDANTWFLPEVGEPNLHALEDFAYRALGDMSVIGKKVVRQYYLDQPKFSYFSGCSNGGRQGYALALRYPKAFDGIAACAPGLYWDHMSDWIWASQLMQDEGAYPWPCELDALRDAALEACDTLDGVRDRVLQDPEACKFDPSSMIGKTINCSPSGKQVNISEIASKIAKGVWQGIRPLPGVNFQTETGGYDVDLKASAATICSNDSCVAELNPLTTNWLRIFVKKDMNWDPSTMNRSEYEALRKQSVQEYESIIGSPSHDFSKFRKAGGKMITYNGMVSILQMALLQCL